MSLEELVQKIFKIPTGDVKDTMSPETIPTWDSMNYLLFISEVEKNFSIQFTVDEVVEAETLGDIRKAIIAKGVKL